VSPARILVVDDDAAMLRTVERVLGPHHSVGTADGGEAALRLARGLAPELAILDVNMPGMDGFELLARLRAEHPGLDAIFMTGVVHELDESLVRSIRERAFYFIQKPFERELLLALVERCLELRRLLALDRSHRTRLESELAAARTFQQGLLPAPSARVGSLSVAWRYEPCSELGGDFVDHATDGAGRLALALADVSGHGVSAAMLTSVVKSAFQGARADGFHPLAVVRRVASAVQPFDEGRFVTLFCARLDPSGELEYVNAGHPPALLLPPPAAPGPLEPLGLTGPLVSPAFPEVGWELGRRSLRPGARLLVVSDGLLEARGPEGLFGEARLAALAGRSTGEPRELLAELVSAVTAFAAGRPLDDDLTLLVAELAGVTARAGTRA
jgi:sigma-B regulation protein RsbU (phosphoserine phosphatase)